METGWMSIFFCQAFNSSLNRWLQNKNLAFFSDLTQNHHPLIWKVLLYKNHHLQFEFLLNVQECSVVVQFLKHLPWQDLNTYQYSFWVFHHIRISFSHQYLLQPQVVLQCSVKNVRTKNYIHFVTLPACSRMRMNLISFD